jgi:hypothetical protein
MTYQDLIETIQAESQHNPEILAQDVMIYDSQNDEYYAISYTDITEEKTCDALDPDHFIIAY